MVDANMESVNFGLEALTVAQREIGTSTEALSNAVSALSPAPGGLPHLPNLAFVTGLLMGALGAVETARVSLCPVIECERNELGLPPGEG